MFNVWFVLLKLTFCNVLDFLMLALILEKKLGRVMIGLNRVIQASMTKAVLSESLTDLFKEQCFFFLPVFLHAPQ